MYGLREIAQVIGGELLFAEKAQGQAEPAGVSIDTRRLRPGQVFFAIRGPERNGHAFVADAFARGAPAAVVSEVASGADAGHAVGPLIRVEDPVVALQLLAAHYRRSLQVRVVGITGSNGKTTTKEMAAAVLSRRFRTAKTEGNLNNHLGVPLTLLAIPPDAEVAVVEMGMNHPGEIRRLAEVSRPQVGLVTNIAESHLGPLGSLGNVLRAKGELLEYLKSQDTAIVNADDPQLTSGVLTIRARTMTFGIESSADVRASDVEAVGERGARFVLFGRTIELGVFGREFVYDALAAAAVGVALGVPEAEACEALEGSRPFRMRMETISAGGVTVINDAYNANPASVRAALTTLSRMPADGRRIAVLGDMLELGEHSARLHAEVGAYLARVGVDLLLTQGTFAEDILRGALSSGMPAATARHLEGGDEVREALRRTVRPGDLVLVKASRGCRMETVVEDLLEFLRRRE